MSGTRASGRGSRAPEIEERFPGFLQGGRRPPGFEGDESIAARALDAFAALVGGLAAGSVALVVTHGGVIRTTERALGADSELVPNLGGRWLHTGDGDGATGAGATAAAGGGGRLVLGERALLLDAHEIEVTRPRQL